MAYAATNILYVAAPTLTGVNLPGFTKKSKERGRKKEYINEEITDHSVNVIGFEAELRGEKDEEEWVVTKLFAVDQGNVTSETKHYTFHFEHEGKFGINPEKTAGIANAQISHFRLWSKHKKRIGKLGEKHKPNSYFPGGDADWRKEAKRRNK